MDPRDVQDWLLPQVTDEDRPFWAAARNHSFRMQCCTDCGFVRWPPGPACPRCWSDRSDWRELSGDGTVSTWVVYHRPYYEHTTDFSPWEDAVPYNVAEVELEEGPRYVATVDVDSHEDIYRGMPVSVAFRDLTEAITIPVFEPAEEDRSTDERADDATDDTAEE